MPEGLSCKSLQRNKSRQGYPAKPPPCRNAISASVVSVRDWIAMWKPAKAGDDIQMHLCIVDHLVLPHGSEQGNTTILCVDVFRISNGMMSQKAREVAASGESPC